MKPFLSDWSLKFLWLGIFATAMGFLEAIVVVYLRQIYYPDGFDFPMKLLTPEMLSVEWLREITTIVMLGAVAILAGRNNLQRLMYFLYCFAVWDIFYYIALKAILDWPASLLTWDLLFLIPIPWMGPVLAPVICSLTMIFMAATIIPLQEKGYNVRIRLCEWIPIYTGGFLILFTFLADYLKLIKTSGILKEGATQAEKGYLLQNVSQYVPDNYNWLIFTLGEAGIICVVVIVIIKSLRNGNRHL